MTEPRSWAMWAGIIRPHGQDEDVFYAIDQHRRYVEHHGLVPHKVIATEDPQGMYWSWIQTDAEWPTMIHGYRPVFSMCFPYGYQAEVDAGKGEVVRLRIEFA